MNNIYVFGKRNMTPVKNNISIKQYEVEARTYKDVQKPLDKEGSFTERAAYRMVMEDYDVLEKCYHGPLEYDEMRKHIMEPRAKIIRLGFGKGNYAVCPKKNKCYGKKISYKGYANIKQWNWSEARVKRFVDKIISRRINEYISGKLKHQTVTAMA